jgi:hypothetical protein
MVTQKAWLERRQLLEGDDVLDGDVADVGARRAGLGGVRLH